MMYLLSKASLDDTLIDLDQVAMIQKRMGSSASRFHKGQLLDYCITLKSGQRIEANVQDGQAIWEQLSAMHPICQAPQKFAEHIMAWDNCTFHTLHVSGIKAKCSECGCYPVQG